MLQNYFKTAAITLFKTLGMKMVPWDNPNRAWQSSELNIQWLR